MHFNEKLDFLLKLTNTTNSRLAHIARLDNSFISRLRSGARLPARKENYIGLFAKYFARNITEDYQLAAIIQAARIKKSTLPATESGLAEFLYDWLHDNEKEWAERNKSKNSHSRLSFASDNNYSENQPIIKKLDEGLNINTNVFFGNQGKRDAVRKFLHLVLSKKNPSFLFLHSEEDMIWLTENREFAAEWMQLMDQVIAKGNKIKIIHTVSRSLDEMLSAIIQWLPLYMSSAIESYFYPKHRDGLFKRTLFLSPDCAAVFSNSFGDGSENAITYLSTEKAILLPLQDEFCRYLDLCRPLIHAFTPDKQKIFLKALSEFENQHCNSILKSNGFSSITMPPDLVSKILAKTPHYNDNTITLYIKRRIEVFKRNLETNKFTEIIYLPELDNVFAGKTPIPLMFYTGELFYSSQEYLLHLQNIINLMETYNNYNVFIQDKKTTEHLMIYVKEETGVIVAKYEFPQVFFGLNESNMTSAFWSYMENITNTLSKEKQDKKHVLRQLKNYESALINHL
ncbi:hypothetical protein [Petroclostridium xylanilyticum]|uniref:hypothetical protein n=1 Tax=Petroclostridium xylanilyticum TaxID=1792311 RepID=UPI000B982F33|nr:hypothetical protein [Petroclostridium xylanilyticum]